ncbi:hypothetical protein KR51_00017830 [Rubidibacter lacunae KORDI 51-2]|uniref:Uncharacterized protein n=1 Tax=Rubidibacter lacunae KORDI 51-2 TaxID=582515 RepID=U5DPE0_9CHRO|nr:hypothetical protein [Rubidibacter lacunae]ERN41565.1 hypothetical protein KR51_00017830 [Rubidibacter lacunae KORDI 51-2]
MPSCILRLEKVKIHKKFEPLPFDKAEVKFYSFVADESLSIPELDVLLASTDPSTVRAQIKDVSKAILDRWESVLIENVKKNHVFTFGDTGKVIYRSTTIPESLDWLMLVVEIDRDIQNLSDRIDEILPEASADKLAENLAPLAELEALPQLDAARAISKFLLRSVTTFMKNNKNDQIGLIEQSFVRKFDYPDGRREGDEIQDLTGNMWYTYKLFADAD